MSRAIVANLAWRFRLADRLRRSYEPGTMLHHLAVARAAEAWNAYIASKKILEGLQP